VADVIIDSSKRFKSDLYLSYPKRRYKKKFSYAYSERFYQLPLECQYFSYENESFSEKGLLNLSVKTYTKVSLSNHSGLTLVMIETLFADRVDTLEV
jgi:hypothetical protein